jgi:hypothetical protein
MLTKFYDAKSSYINDKNIKHLCQSFTVYMKLEWKKLHNEELHSFYSSLNIFEVINSRSIKCAGYKVYMREKRCAYCIKFWSKNLKEREHLPH